MSKPKKSVGYGKPPEEHQFKPGQSGNSKGRPKKAQPVMTHPLHAYLKEANCEMLPVLSNGKVVGHYPALALIYKVLLRKAAQGDAKALGGLIGLFGFVGTLPVEQPDVPFDWTAEMQEDVDQVRQLMSTYKVIPVDPKPPVAPPAQGKAKDDHDDEPVPV